MSKLLIMTMMCLGLVLTGCKTSEFDPATASHTASVAGTASAMVALSIPAIATNQQVKTIIYTATKTIETVVPATNQTFAAAAGPVIIQTVDKLVADGKLKPEYSALTKEGCILAMSGIDLVMDKYPKIKENTTDVNIVVKAYVTAFNQTFMPTGLSVSKDTATMSEVREMDKAIREKNAARLKWMLK